MGVNNTLSMLAGVVVAIVMAVLLYSAVQELAAITDMCMSSHSLSRSIMSTSIARFGKTRWNAKQLERAGYEDARDERAEHETFVNYLRANPTGIQMGKVLIDTGVVS